MTNPDPFRIYLDEVRKKLATGVAKEHAYRGAFERLLKETGDGVQAVNEPSHIECGAPDFIVLRGSTPVGYVEAKDIDESLDAAQRTGQLKRYRESLNNLILTDYLEFRWYVEGEERDRARLGTVTRDGKVRSTRDGIGTVSHLLQGFFAQEAPMLGTAKELAQRMAGLARMIRDLIEEAYKRESTEGRLHGQLAAFRDTLIPELSAELFADMYAQTITYGLFAARVRAPGGRGFTRQQAAWNLPKTNPFLRKLFNEIAGPDLPQEIAWAVDDLAHLLGRADMSEVLRDFGKATKQEDPIVHFYETFLAHYNPRMRQRRGVYYTPEPVVSYIVRSIDHLLKTRFERPMGLADEGVMILDPACGTGTFLYFVIQEIHATVVRERGEGAWNSYVREKLLPRIFGFELLMAPYAMAHMKLAMQLEELGYDFQGDERLGIYLSNTLDEPRTKAEILGFAGFITEEGNSASEVKRDLPIMVVLGNPPYSTFGRMNKGPWIMDLVKGWRPSGEKKWNPDDFMKFMRWAQWRLERTGAGVLAFITNNTYIDGVTHRRMRESLMETFADIHILNLHGSSMRGETSPDGSQDENVFDIRPGVAIGLFTKLQGYRGLGGVCQADLWGVREAKYAYLLENDVSSTEWSSLEPAADWWFFVPIDRQWGKEYYKYVELSTAFRVRGNAIGTDRDALFYEHSYDTLADRMKVFYSAEGIQSPFADQYRVRNSSSYPLLSRRQSTSFSGSNLRRCLYRPFDVRWLYYDPSLISRPALGVMQHLRRDNVALLVTRQVSTGDFRHVFVSATITDRDPLSLATRERSQVFPLYQYTTADRDQPGLFTDDDMRREPNLNSNFIAAVADRLVLDFIAEGKGDLENNLGPEDIFHYMYAVFHSPTYRERYAEFLKIDFPRLPLTSDLGLFRALAGKGEELVALHLMESPTLDHLVTRFMGKGDNQVEKVRYVVETPQVSADLGGLGEGLAAGRVYIDKTQYFEGVEREVWEFHIGGYQVLEKWLKDRKGRTLSHDDITHYGKIVVALKETIRLMAEIDDLIPSWPIE